MNSDQQAFLKLLEINPDDTPTRLTYADWLDDHDQPEFAERMRKWPEAKQWLTWFAGRCGHLGIEYDDEGWETSGDVFTFDDVVDAGHDWLADGNIYRLDDQIYYEGHTFTQYGSEQAREMMYKDGIKELYWKHWQTITGIQVEPIKQGTVFSCSC